MAADAQSDREESCVCYISTYLLREEKLKVNVMSGTLRVGMWVSTVGGTHEYNWSGSVKTITVSGDPSRAEIEEANVGDIVWVYGPSGESRGMFRGAYLITKGVEKVVRPYTAKVTYSGQMKGQMKNGFSLDRIALRDTTPGVPGKIASKLADITDGVKIAYTSFDSLSPENSKILFPGDVIKINVSCWHPLDTFDLLFRGIPIGTAQLDKSLIKGIPT